MAKLPDYASCPCGEYHEAALKLTSRGVRCANCRSRRHPRGRCLICEQYGPIEHHHPAGRARVGDFTVPICLNCHLVLTACQRMWGEQSALQALALATFDGLSLRLSKRPSSLSVGILALVGLAFAFLFLDEHRDRLHAFLEGAMR